MVLGVLPYRDPDLVYHDCPLQTERWAVYKDVELDEDQWIIDDGVNPGIYDALFCPYCGISLKEL